MLELRLAAIIFLLLSFQNSWVSIYSFDLSYFFFFCSGVSNPSVSQIPLWWKCIMSFLRGVNQTYCSPRMERCEKTWKGAHWLCGRFLSANSLFPSWYSKWFILTATSLSFILSKWKVIVASSTRKQGEKEKQTARSAEWNKRRNKEQQ